MDLDRFQAGNIFIMDVLTGSESTILREGMPLNTGTRIAVHRSALRQIQVYDADTVESLRCVFSFHRATVDSGS